MADVDELLKDVYEELKPDSQRIRKETEKTIKKINSALGKKKIKAKAIAGGSVAKGTFLKGDHDCDLFVKFDYNRYKDKDISGLLEGALRKSFRKVSRVHGSRDYYHIINELRYEIIPVLDVKSPAKALNITDCSPLHVNWVNKFPKMKKDIMLTKAFCKAAGVYGAESYIKGFSGHVVDIMTIYYGGFLNLLKAASKWKSKEVLDYYNAHKGKALLNLNRSKTQSPLIVIDPVQPDRNAAAALGDEKFQIFRKRASEFMKNPSKRFFAAEAVDLDRIRKDAQSKGGKLIIIDVKAKTGKEDVVGAKLLKSLEFIVSQLKQNDFKIIAHGWKWDKARKAFFWIAVDKKDLPQTEVREGPPVKVKKHYENFRKAHKNAFEKKGRVYAEVKRKFVNAEVFLRYLMKTEYIKEKVEEIRIRSEIRMRGKMIKRGKVAS